MWLGLGSLSTFSLTIISAAILSRYFDKAEYGTYRQILYVYNTLLVIFTAGLPKVFAFFLPRYSLEEGKDIVLKISKLLFLFGFIFSVTLFAGSGLIASILKNPELAIGLKYFSPIPMLLLPTLGIEGIFSTYKKTIFIAIYNTTTRLLMLLFIVLPVILYNGTYLNAIYGWLAVSVLTLILAYFFKGIPFRNIEKAVAPLKFKEIFAYSIPLVGASIAGLAIRSADQFYISRYFGAATFAEYANGFMQIPFVLMVTGAASTVLMPQFSKMISEKAELNKIAELWKSTLVKSAVIIYPMVLFFIFHAKPIVIFLFSETYANSAGYFQIAMVANFFNIIAFSPLLFSLGETRYYSKVHIIGAAIVWGGGFIVVNVFPKPYYIAVLSVLTSIIIVLINMNKISKLLGLGFWELIPIKSFAKIILHSLAIMLIVLFFKHYIWHNLNILSILIIDSISFFVLLLLTAKFFGNDYIRVIDPLIKKYRR